MFKAPENLRMPFHPLYGRMDASMGNNGVFRAFHQATGRTLNIIASDGMGWEHVSVSVANRSSDTPNWADMCFVKSLFWGPEDAVMQLHPPQSAYVNNHAGCLHLWRPVGQSLPLPLEVMVGDKNLTPEDVEGMTVAELGDLLERGRTAELPLAGGGLV